MSTNNVGYFLPSPSQWPIIGSIGIFFLALGAVLMMNDYSSSTIVLSIGSLIIIYMCFGWFGAVINESESGKYNKQVDISYRWAMSWFIFSEVMFFAGFFGALFYMRVLSVPWLAILILRVYFGQHFRVLASIYPGIEEQFTPWVLGVFLL